MDATQINTESALNKLRNLIAGRSSKPRQCAECGGGISASPTTIDFRGQEIHLFDPATCAACLRELCERYSTVCANCGEPIPPYSQVGVLKGDRGEKYLVHMTASCSTAGSAFHGYWGRGELRQFVEIEAC